MSKKLSLALLPFLGASYVSAATIELIVDNDFAIYAGTTNSITRTVYQNSSGWGNQIAEAQSINLNLINSETTFYILAMDGGAGGGLQGMLNGVDITSVFVEKSNDISSYLYQYSDNAVNLDNGTYTVQFADVQSALAVATWSTPQLGVGFFNQPSFPVATMQANLFRLSGSSVNIAVPEPSTYGLGLSVMALAVVAIRRRKRSV